MDKLNLPEYAAVIREHEGKEQIYDRLRNRFVALTPEEWVRQNFVNYLMEFKGYPPALMANEIQISLNGMSRRCDSVVYNRSMQARTIIEYKRPTVEITRKVFEQISRYNLVMKVDYLIVSNGMKHYCCKMNYESQTFEFLTDIPEFRDDIETTREKAKNGK